MKALIAVQRKMLELIFVVDKNKIKFENDYQQKRTLNANEKISFYRLDYNRLEKQK